MARQSDPDTGREPRGGGALGGLLLAVGGALLIATLAADIGGTPALERLAFRLGLAWMPLLMNLGLALALTGGWLLWRSRRS